MTHHTAAHLDEDRSEPFRAQLFVDAQEVDLGHGDGLAADAECGGNAGDEAHQALSLACPHPDVPFLPEAWRLQRPLQEFSRVLEPVWAQLHCLLKSM